MIVLLVLLTFTVCILVNLAIEKRAERKAPAAAKAARTAVYPLVPEAAADGIPGGIFFHGGHTWTHLELSGKARVGVDEFALGIIGPESRIELPQNGKPVLQGRPLFAAVRAGKRVEFVSPIDGVVCGINADINNRAESTRKDPYHAGWVVALQPSNIAQNLKGLMSATEAGSWLEREVTAFKEFLALHIPGPREAGATLPDGGTHVEGVLAQLDGEVLRMFERKFLR